MSALPPKAAIDRHDWNVCFGPKETSSEARGMCLSPSAIRSRRWRPRELIGDLKSECLSGRKSAIPDTQRFKSTLRTKSLVLVVTLALDVGGKMNHKLSSRFESVDFEGTAKLADG